jgi:microtubule-associated protein-like 6
MQQMVPYSNPAMASPMYGMNPMMMMNPMMSMPWMNAGVAPSAAAPLARAASVAPSAAAKKKVVIAPIKLQPSADDAGEEESLFDTDEATDAVQFGMVKPWVGTVAALTPDNAPKNNALAPDARLQLEWVYGLKSDETRQHVHLDSSNRIIFPAAAVLVAYDAQAHTQSHFFGPTDEITCVAQDPTNSNVYVVGQGAAIVDKRSSDPFLSIIDVGSGDVSALPKRHKKGICSVAVSADGSMAASCGLDDNFNIIVWDLKGREAIAQEKAMNKTKVLHMAWSTVSPNEFCAVGQDTVAFYSLEGRKLTVTAANFNGNQKQLFTCVAYTKKGTCIVGAKDGSVYAFGEQTCKKVFPVHNSVVTTILPFDGGVITAAAGQIRINNSKLEQLKSFDTGDSFARSVCVRNSTLVVATNHGDLLVIGDMSKNELPEIVHSAHHDGELYAVAPHPDASSGVFASVGEDNKLIAWNAKQRSATKVAVITTEESKRGKVIVRAATTSTHGTNQCARSIAFSPNGSHLAVGTNEGKVNIYDARSFAPITSVDCNSYGKANAKNPEHWIQALSYNPAGTCLAVGTHGSVIVLLDVAKGYAFAEKLTSHNAAVTALDWSTDGKFIASICRGYELLFRTHFSVGNLSAIVDCPFHYVSLPTRLHLARLQGFGACQCSAAQERSVGNLHLQVRLGGQRRVPTGPERRLDSVDQRVQLQGFDRHR